MQSLIITQAQICISHETAYSFQLVGRRSAFRVGIPAGPNSYDHSYKTYGTLRI